MTSQINISTNSAQNAASTIYPYAIDHLCAMWVSSPIFSVINDSDVRLLHWLFKMTSVSTPNKAITATRSTLANLCGKSTESINRSLRHLKKIGLITCEQKANRGLKGSHSPIYWSTNAIKEINAIVGALREAGKAKRLAVNSDTSRSSYPQTQSSTKKQSQKETSDDDNLSTSDQDKFVVIGKAAIPQELAWIVEQERLTSPAILKLMGIASKSGKRLTDVVAYAKKWIKSKKGKVLYAYLSSAISWDKDFKYLNAADAQEAENKTLAEARKRLAERKAVEWQGRVIAAPNGTILTFFENAMFSTVDQHGAERWGNLTPDLAERITEESWRIIK